MRKYGHNHHADRAERYMKEHGLERKENSTTSARALASRGAKRIGSAIKARYEKAQEQRAYRKSPAGRREKIQNLAFEAKEEQLKTSIAKSKGARRASVWGGSQPATRVTKYSSNRPARQQQSMGFGGMDSLFSSGGMGQTHAYNGMNDLLGTGNSMMKPKRKMKQPKQYSGMDSLF